MFASGRRSLRPPPLFLGGTVITFDPLRRLEARDMARIATGHVAAEYYRSSLTGSADTRWWCELDPARCEVPYVNAFAHPPENLRRYHRPLGSGTCQGARDGARLVGPAIGEPMAWNRPLVLWGFLHRSDAPPAGQRGRVA